MKRALVLLLMLWCWVCPTEGRAQAGATGPRTELTPEDLEHGKRQVERMLADRPGMAVYRPEKDNKAGYVEEGDAIYRWAVEAYAGKYVGERVYWVNGDTEGAQACHVNTRLFGIYALQVKNAADDQRDGFEVMWSGCIYEMLSMSQKEAWASLEKGAIDNLLSTEEFVEEGARVEWLAHRKLAQFHEELWTPWARLVGAKSDREIWVMANSEVYENWRAQYTEREHYPWQPFLQIYEWLSRFSEDKILRYRKLDSASRW